MTSSTRPFTTVRLAEAQTVTAPDGSRVDILSASPRGSMARFSLESGRVSKAVRHRSVEELWYVVAGEGEMWRSDGAREERVALASGVSISILPGTAFQFRSTGAETLEAIGVTMPPWPGMNEAEFVPGKW